MGELIAGSDGKAATDGSGAAGDVFNLGHDLLTEPDSWNSAFAAGLVGIDVLSSLENPLGTLISAGVGWLIEHLPGLSDVWDKLMGDAAAIEQIANTWDNISKALSSDESTYSTASNQIEQWTGPASDSYRQVANAYACSLGGTAAECEALAIVVRGVGALCATLKDLVYTIIADFIEFTVLPAILSALATAWCTFGGSVAAAITYIEIQADISAEQITIKVTKTTTEIIEVSERAAKAIAKLGDMEKALAKLGKEVEKSGMAKDAALALAHGGTEQTKGGVENRAE